MPTSKSTRIASIVASTVLSCSSVFAGVVAPGFNSSSLAANDDFYTGLLPIGFSVNFFGVTHTDLYANNNGNVTFNAPLSTYTPFGLTGSSTTPIIAAFFGDVDTRNPASELMKYGSGTFAGRTAFGVTWDGVGVGYYSARADKLNNFQLLLVDRSDITLGDFDIYFNYDRIQWETGEASGGTNGLGGSSARAGYTSGTGATSVYAELAGSGVNGAFLDGGPNSLVANSNIGDPGRYLFQVRNGTVVNPPTGVPDGGSALILLGLALAGMAAVRRRVL